MTPNFLEEFFSFFLFFKEPSAAFPRLSLFTPYIFVKSWSWSCRFNSVWFQTALLAWHLKQPDWVYPGSEKNFVLCIFFPEALVVLRPFDWLSASSHHPDYSSETFQNHRYLHHEQICSAFTDQFTNSISPDINESDIHLLFVSHFTEKNPHTHHSSSRCTVVMNRVTRSSVFFCFVFSN